MSDIQGGASGGQSHLMTQVQQLKERALAVGCRPSPVVVCCVIGQAPLSLYTCGTEAIPAPQTSLPVTQITILAPPASLGLRTRCLLGRRDLVLVGACHPHGGVCLCSTSVYFKPAWSASTQACIGRGRVVCTH